MAKLGDWVVDYIYLVKGVMAFRRVPPKHYRQDKAPGNVPVILLTGLSLRWSFLQHLGDRISRAGHPVYAIPNLRRNFISVSESAQFTREVIEEHDLKRVIIVSHSKGGIIGKYLLAHFNKDKRIHTVIAVATPFSGSRLARMIPHRAIREMLPDSRLIKELQAKKAVNKNIISIIPEFDNHIWAEEGSYLKGARNIKVQVRGHHRIVFDKKVEDTIMKTLSTA